MEIDTKHFKEKLEQELETLTEELQKVGRINPDNKNDWEAKGAEMDIQQADQNERADAIEEYEINRAVLQSLEVRYNNVKGALKKIENGTYGVCEVDGEQIELKRLEANPAATTCTMHLDKEK